MLTKGHEGIEKEKETEERERERLTANLTQMREEGVNTIRQTEKKNEG